MYKNKRLLSIVIIATLGITVSGAYAVGRIYTNKTLDDLKGYVDNNNLNIQVVDSEQQMLESNYNETLKQYNESRKQTILYQNQLDRLNFDRTQYTKKKEQQQMAEKYKLQVDYYNVCLSIKQFSLAQSELEVLNKQISVEQEKLKIGKSTQLTVDDLNSRKRIVQDKITSINQSVDSGKNALRSRLNETTDAQFDPSFSIPSVVDGSDIYSLSALRKKCEDNHLGLLKTNAYIGFHSTLISNLASCVGENDLSYRSALSEKSKLQADANVLKQSIDSGVEKRYNAFKQSIVSYLTFQERYNVLNKQMVVLKAKYDNGDISELQYLSDRFTILNELNNGYNTIVAKINAKTVVNLIENGIIID